MKKFLNREQGRGKPLSLRASSFLLISDFEFRTCELSMAPSQPHWVALKERLRCLISSRLPALAPLGPVLDDPISQSPLESNIAPGLLGFNQLMIQDLFAFRLKFPIKRGVLQQIVGRQRLF